MNDLYEGYCLADPIFYDTPAAVEGGGDGLLAMIDRIVPDGWTTWDNGVWLGVHPIGIETARAGLEDPRVGLSRQRPAGADRDVGPLHRRPPALQVPRHPGDVPHPEREVRRPRRLGQVHHDLPARRRRAGAHAGRARRRAATASTARTSSATCATATARCTSATAASSCRSAAPLTARWCRRSATRTACSCPTSAAARSTCPTWVDVPAVLAASVAARDAEPDDAVPLRRRPRRCTSPTAAACTSPPPQATRRSRWSSRRPAHTPVSTPPGSTPSTGCTVSTACSCASPVSTACRTSTSCAVTGSTRFLVEELIEGPTLNEEVVARHPLIHPDPDGRRSRRVSGLGTRRARPADGRGGRGPRARCRPRRPAPAQRPAAPRRPAVPDRPRARPPGGGVMASGDGRPGVHRAAAVHRFRRRRVRARGDPPVDVHAVHRHPPLRPGQGRRADRVGRAPLRPAGDVDRGRASRAGARLAGERGRAAWLAGPLLAAPRAAAVGVARAARSPPQSPRAPRPSATTGCSRATPRSSPRRMAGSAWPTVPPACCGRWPRPAVRSIRHTSTGWRLTPRHVAVPGLYDGVSGIALALDRCGRPHAASASTSTPSPTTTRCSAVARGSRSAMLDDLDLAHHVADRGLAALDATPDVLPRAGLLHGWSGLALLLIRLAERTSVRVATAAGNSSAAVDTNLLDAAERALRRRSRPVRRRPRRDVAGRRGLAGAAVRRHRQRRHRAGPRPVPRPPAGQPARHPPRTDSPGRVHRRRDPQWPVQRPCRS